MSSTGLEEFGIVDDDPEESSAPVPQSEGEEDTAASEELDEEELSEVLGKVQLFEGLLPVHLARIGKLARVVTVGKNEYLFRHGDEGDGLYIIMDGSIRISRNLSGMGEEALAVLRNGHHFGEMSLIDDDVPRSADAICHEAARLLRLPKHDLRDLMFVDRELAYELLWRFVRTLSARVRDSNDRLIMLSASSKF